MSRLLVVVMALLVISCGKPAPPPQAGPAASSPPAAGAPAPALPSGGVRNVDAVGAAQWLRDHPETVVLDVRTPEEYAEGHLAGSTLLDFKAEGFREKLDGLDKSRTYLVHCRSGRRSAETRDLMTAAGFQHVVHLDGGIEAWMAAGQPTEK